MNRKLHNTLMAIIASSSLLTLGLIAGTPAMPSSDAAAAQDAFATLDKVPTFPDASKQEGEPNVSAPQPPSRVVRGNRQSVSMPFFSFVPRG